MSTLSRLILPNGTFLGYPWDPLAGVLPTFFSETVLFWEWNRHHHWIRQPWYSALSYLTLVNWAILCKVTFVGYPWVPSRGPADFFSDTVLFWEWIRHHHWIRQPWFSALSYLTLVNWAILCKVTFVGYPWDPSLGPADFFRTLSCSESELDITIGFGYLDLVHFHTSHL